jgi:hypothetical protein
LYIYKQKNVATKVTTFIPIIKLYLILC